MTRIELGPAARVATFGSTVSFEVKVDGSDAASLAALPCAQMPQARVLLDVQRHRLTVQIPKRAGFASLDFYVEARAASGEVVARNHAEVITADPWMLPAFAAAAVTGFALATMGAGGQGTLAVALMLLGSLVALAAAGSLAFCLWGRYVGFRWHFRP